MTGSLTMSGPKISLSRRLPIAESLRPKSAPGYRRHDRDLVLLAHLGLEARPQPDVLVIQVHVDELPQLALVVQQPVAEARVAGVERLDRRLEIARLHRHGDLSVGQPAKRAWDSKLRHVYIFTFSRNDFSVGSISTRLAWPSTEASTSAVF